MDAKINTKYNYFCVAQNFKYDLLIIKNIGSTHQKFLHNLDINMLSAWEILYIWEDTYKKYHNLFEICSSLGMNISKNFDYILVSGQQKPSSIEDIDRKNDIDQLKQIMQLININKINIKDELCPLNVKFKQLEKRTRQVEYNLIPIIYKYMINDAYFHIYMMCLKYNNIPKDMIEYMTTHFNIYKIKNRYFTQVRDTFCETNEIGLPFETFNMINTSPKTANRFCFQNDGDYRCGNNSDCAHVISIYKVLLNNEDKDIYRINNSLPKYKCGNGYHNYHKCIRYCPSICQIKKRILNNLLIICQKVYATYIERNVYSVENVSFYENKSHKHSLKITNDKITITIK